MADKNVFRADDKVFVKIEDYPAWPAIISSVKDENSLRPKYVVRFYGTYASAECVPEELYSFEENKVEFGKQKRLGPFKRAQFVEALNEIENGFVIPVCGSRVSCNRLSNKKPHSNSGIKKKFDKSSVSSSKKSDSSTKSLRTPKKTRTSSRVPLKRISKKPAIKKGAFVKCIKNLCTSQPVVLLERVRCPSKTTEPKTCVTLSRNIGTDGQNCRTNGNDLQSSVTAVEQNEIPESGAGVEECDRTAKSTLKIESTIISNSRKPRQSINNNEHSPINICAGGSKTECFLPKKRVYFEGVARENGREMTMRSNRRLRPNKKEQNGKNVESIRHDTLIDSNSEKNHAISVMRNVSEKSQSHEDEEEEEKEKEEEEEEKEEEEKEKEEEKEEEKEKEEKEEEEEEEEEKEKEEEEVHRTRGKTRGKSELQDPSRGFPVDTGSEVRTKKAQSSFKVEKLQELLDVMECTHKLRTALRVDMEPNYKVTIEALLQIKKKNIPAFLWIKNPDIVETLVKVSKYIGNIDECSATKETLKRHRQNASLVRGIAQEVLVKIAARFNVSNMLTFGSVYYNAVIEFKKKFSHLNADVVCSAVSEDELKRYL